MHTIIITADVANGLRFRPLTAGQGLGARYGRDSTRGLSLAGHRRHVHCPLLGTAAPARTTSGLVFSTLAWSVVARCEYLAKDSSEASECQAIVEMPSCLGKSKGAVSLHDAHPSRPEVKVVGPQPDGAGISLYGVGLPLSTETDKWLQWRDRQSICTYHLIQGNSNRRYRSQVIRENSWSRL